MPSPSIYRTRVCSCRSMSCTKRHDKIISTHRAHAHYIAKGGNINTMIAELYGKSTGCLNGLGGSMYLQDINAGGIRGCTYSRQQYCNRNWSRLQLNFSK